MQRRDKDLLEWLLRIMFISRRSSSVQVDIDYIEDTVAISQYPLSAALACAKICTAFEEVWGVVWFDGAADVVQVEISSYAWRRVCASIEEWYFRRNFDRYQHLVSWQKYWKFLMVLITSRICALRRLSEVDDLVTARAAATRTATTKQQKQQE